MSAEKKPELERVYSTTEAKNQLSAMISFVQGPGEVAIIESHGRPRAALISLEDLEAFRRLKDRARREQSLKRLRKLRDEVRLRNQDLSDEAAEELASRFVRDVVDDLHSVGRLHSAPE